MSNFHLIAYISISTVLVPILVAIVQWNKIPKEIAALRWLLIASIIFDLIMLKMSSLGMNNLAVGDVFMFIQFIILLYIFSRQFARQILFIAAGLIVALFYAVGLFTDDFIAPPVVALIRSGAVESLFMITASVALFYKLLNELKIVNIHRLPILWISFATLFYYSGNLFVFLTSGYLEDYPDTLILTWMFHNVLNVTKNMLFAVALWQSYRTVRAQHG